MAWNRDTSWRQGHVLPAEALTALGLTASADAIAVVISHDCDLANDDMSTEPCVELIVGRLIPKVSGDCAHAKVPRRLHISFETPEGERHVELIATQKHLCPKEVLVHFDPLVWSLSEDNTSILQRWLGSRYRRAAFPDAFESILKGAKLHERIAKILSPLGHSIPAIFFDVSQHDSLYRLGIILLYDTGKDAVAAERDATNAASAIGNAFEAKLFNGAEQAWQGVELIYCDPVSDEALTYRQSTMLKQWRLEHLSLRETPQQPMTDE